MGACPPQTATTGRKVTVTFQSLYLGKAQSRVTAAHFPSVAAHHIMHFPLVWMQQKLMHHALHTWGCGLAIHLHTVHPMGWWKGTEAHINDIRKWHEKHSLFCIKSLQRYRFGLQQYPQLWEDRWRSPLYISPQKLRGRATHETLSLSKMWKRIHS